MAISRKPLDVDNYSALDGGTGLAVPGYYRRTNLNDIINNFIIGYVGDGKTLPKVPRYEVAFWAQRAVQEFSYDVFHSEKSMEIQLSSTLQMSLPSDYVNWVKLYLFQGNTLRELTENIQVQSAVSFIQSSTSSFTYDSDNNATVVSSTLDAARTDGSLNSIYLNQNNEADANGNCIDCDDDIYNYH